MVLARLRSGLLLFWLLVLALPVAAGADEPDQPPFYSGTGLSSSFPVALDLRTPQGVQLPLSASAVAASFGFYGGRGFQQEGWTHLVAGAVGAAFTIYLRPPWEAVVNIPGASAAVSSAAGIYLARPYALLAAAGATGASLGTAFSAYLRAPWVPLSAGGSALALAPASPLYLGYPFSPPQVSISTGQQSSLGFAAYLGRGFALPDAVGGGVEARSGGTPVYLGKDFAASILAGTNALANSSSIPVYLGPGFDPVAFLSGTAALAAATPVYLVTGFASLVFTGLHSQAVGSLFALYLDRTFQPPTANGGSFALSPGFTIYLWREYFFALAYSPGFIIDLRTVSGVGPGVIGMLLLQTPQPNPFSRTTTIGFEVPVRTTVRLDIFDAGGRHVRCLIDDEVDSGRHSVAWDGRDESGQACPSGTYFSRLKTESGVLRRKLVRIR